MKFIPAKNQKFDIGRTINPFLCDCQACDFLHCPKNNYCVKMTRAAITGEEFYKANKAMLDISCGLIYTPEMLDLFFDDVVPNFPKGTYWRTCGYDTPREVELITFSRKGNEIAKGSIKVIKTVYDSLTEKYKSIEVGSVKASFANTVKTITQSIASTAEMATRGDAVLASRLTVEAERISAEVTRASQAEGALAASLTATADSITAEVSRASQAEGALSATLTATAESITSEVTRATEAEGRLQSAIEQTATSISMVVDGDKVNAASIIAAINNDSSAVSIAADKINFNGLVTANGTFKIKTDGTFEATGGNLGEFTVTPAGLTARMGYNDNWYTFDIISQQEGDVDEGDDPQEPDMYIKLRAHHDEVGADYITTITADETEYFGEWGGLERDVSKIYYWGATFQHYDYEWDDALDDYRLVAGKRVGIDNARGRVSAYEFANLSDARRKRDIQDFESLEAAIFDGLKPQRFRYKGKDDKLHFGFIAQDIAALLQAAGLEETACALLTPPDKHEEYYSVNYIEIIALCVKEIQALKARVKALETSEV